MDLGNPILNVRASAAARQAPEKKLPSVTPVTLADRERD
jgi:hypothetical protein